MFAVKPESKYVKLGTLTVATGLPFRRTVNALGYPGDVHPKYAALLPTEAPTKFVGARGANGSETVYAVPFTVTMRLVFEEQVDESTGTETTICESLQFVGVVVAEQMLTVLLP